MSREELIKKATEHAKAEGWHVDEYTVRDVTTHGKECNVAFTGKSKKPGEHFTVYLDCKSGMLMRIMPGR